MVTYVLDSSAVLRFLDGEAGHERVAAIIKGHMAGRHRAVISVIHWGEVAGVVCRVHGRETADEVLARLFAFGLEVLPVAPEQAVAAAFLKVETDVPYADAFAAELAARIPDSVLLTADFDLKAVEKKVAVEFLPRK